MGESDGWALGSPDGDKDGAPVICKHLVDERSFVMVLNGEYRLTTTVVAAPPGIGTVIVKVSSNIGSGESRAMNALRNPEVLRSASSVTTSTESPIAPLRLELVMSVRMAAVYFSLLFVSRSACISPPCTVLLVVF